MTIDKHLAHGAFMTASNAPARLGQQSRPARFLLSYCVVLPRVVSYRIALHRIVSLCVVEVDVLSADVSGAPWISTPDSIPAVRPCSMTRPV
jgi:hypothetical protein